jgi:uncharacterized protein (TIGR03067 family)
MREAREDVPPPARVLKGDLMRRVLASLALLALVLAPAVGDDADAGKKELASLEGEWRLVSEEREGAATRYDEGPSILIKGGRWYLSGGKREMAKITIDASTSPRAIDLKMAMDVAEANKGETLEGIFQVDGDDLTFCAARVRGATVKLRPTEFETRSDARLFLCKFKRVKP